MIEKVIILDFGSQYTQLIARRVRELNVYCEIFPYNKHLNLSSAKAIILSGSPFSVNEIDSPRIDLKEIIGKIPVLGLCYGAQFVAKEYGGKVTKSNLREYGRANLCYVSKISQLMKGIDLNSQVWMSHAHTIVNLPKNSDVIASTKDVRVAGYELRKKTAFGLQFHPEVYHSTQGSTLLKNFLVDICGFKQDWTSESFVQSKIKDIRNKIKASPRALSETKASNKNQQNFALLEKLDHIDQNLIRLRELPFFLRNHSILYRFINAILTFLRPIAKRIKLHSGKQDNIDTTINLNGDLIKPFKNIISILNSKKQEINEIVFKKHTKPEISIIVPVYGKLNALSRLISSLHKTKNDANFEIIVVDDCGPQRVSGLIDDKKSNIKVIRNKKNQGFGSTCNIGAKEAKGEYLFFLNSDTIVADHSIDHVLNGFKLASNVGIVGSQLLYENFTRQESGGIIFSDGECKFSLRDIFVSNRFGIFAH